MVVLFLCIEDLCFLNLPLSKIYLLHYGITNTLVNVIKTDYKQKEILIFFFLNLTPNRDIVEKVLKSSVFPILCLWIYK
jgi:hypothetical protein